MKTRVALEHRRLEALFAETRTALRRRAFGQPPADAFRHVRGVLETHLAQEDRLYYPALWALRPSQKPALLAFVRAHDRFRTDLAEIADLLVQGALEDAERAFEAFAEAFGRHEAGEEELLLRLEREIAAASA